VLPTPAWPNVLDVNI